MKSALIARLLVLLNISMSAQDQIKVSNVYVSQHGSDTPSCGTDIQPCKTIAMGVWLAKQHARVYVDGTGSEKTPFSCKSSAIEIPGIYANKSLSIIGVHSMVHVKCQQGSEVNLVKSALETETMVSVSNIKFINTTIQGHDVNLDINECIFNGDRQAVNLVQSTRSITMLFTNSLCVNTGSCMRVLVTGRILPINKISIDVTNSNVVDSGFNNKLSAVGIHMTSTYYSEEPGWLSCDVVLRNVTLQNNTFSQKGIVYSELPYSFTSLRAENVFIYNNTPGMPIPTDRNIAMMNYNGHDSPSYNHSMILRNVTFLQNNGEYYLPIYIVTWNDIFISILDSRFESNYGIVKLIPFNNIKLYIENTFVIGNFGCKTVSSSFEDFFILDGMKNVTVVFKDSTFKSNMCKWCVLGLMSLGSVLRTDVNITNCRFESNAALNPGKYMISIGSSKHLIFTVLDTIFIGSSSKETVKAISLAAGNEMHVLLDNATFKGYLNREPILGGALYLSPSWGTIEINSCTFIGNRAPLGTGGAVAFRLQDGDTLIDPGCIKQRSKVNRQPTDNMDKPHRRWTYNVSVLITNTTFVNNTALSGGALSLSGGNYTIQNCTFIDNFAHAHGGHIYSITDSTRLEILDSTFLQTHSKVINQYRTSVGLFMYSESMGPLMIFNTTMESMWSRDVQSKSLIYISKGNLIDFGDNNQTIVKCPIGSSLDILNYTTIVDTEYKSKPCKIALTLLQFNCKSCPVDTYSLQHGHSLGITKVSGFKCLPCPFGAVCHNKISAKPNYWGYDVKENPSELNFTQCPLGYCNMTDANDFVDYNRCLGNRGGTLCGRCKGKYSETLLSTSCCHDDECKDTWLWGVAVVMVMLMALYLIHKPRLLHMLKRQILWFKYSTDEEDEGEKHHSGGYLKILFYFYQVVNIVLVTTSYNNTIKLYFVQPIIGLFNFQFRLSSSGLLCPFRGLTAVTKQLLFASQVFGVVVMIGVCYFCHRVLRLCRSRPPPNLGPYIGAVVETLLLGYAVFANTSLQLLRCTSLARDWRLFIDGTVSCYQWWQYLLMVFVGTAVVPFILTLALGSHWLHKGSISVKEFMLGCVLPLPYLLYKVISLLRGTHEANQESREWRAAVTKVLFGPFRAPQDDSFGAVYWESILISRRLILIVIYVFVHDPLSKELLLAFTSVAILLHHTIVRPFRDPSANIVEMVSLFCLFTLASINTFKASFISFGEVQKGPLMSFEDIVDWIQIIILTALPVLFLLTVLSAIVSQIVRLIFKGLPYIAHACMKSRDVLVIDDVDRNLLEPCSSTD